MKIPRNTTREVHENPMSFLVAGMVMGSSNAIENQEAQGQCELVNSEVLPVKIDNESLRALEAAGVILGKPIDGDPIFRSAELPKGWEKKPTSHSMWSELVDDKGRKRAAIFYKAAFYDRDAFMRAETRYSRTVDWDARMAEVSDCGKVIKKIGPFGSADNFDSQDAYSAGEKWLDENHPDWRDAAAYWG